MEVARINGILDKWRRDSDYLIEILQDVQDTWRHIPRDTMRYVADELEVPLARVYHIATFYKAFSLEPRGRHEIQVCTGTACHVRGAARVVEAIERELGVDAGKTTADGEYTLEPVRCVGACGLAPVVGIDEEIYGHLSPNKAAKKIARHKKGVAK
ncbi:MAG: NAD(P)H-dependent oxidoreductase subunit E [Proteobacteria bacterium]|nr:NAD(P)H-dependent oxidoreductase subunit E [Pseudomonadota bacterium]